MKLRATKLDASIFVLGVILVGLIFAVAMKTLPIHAEEAAAAVSTSEHFVTIHDSGTKVTIRTDASTVAEVLSRVDITLAPPDIVEPAAETVLDSDFIINIYRAQPVVIVDGGIRTKLLTAATDPASVARAAGIPIYDGDEIKLIASTAFLETGVQMEYHISRNGGRTVTVEEDIAYGTKTIYDGNLDAGMQRTESIGELGRKTLVYKVDFIDNVEVNRTLVSDTVTVNPVDQVIVVGTKIDYPSATPLTKSMGRNRYMTASGILREETYYDLPMSRVMQNCGGGGYYTVRADGVKIDKDGYVIVAAALARYPRCSVVETSLGAGKVYDTGGFAATKPEVFDLATDWTRADGI